MTTADMDALFKPVPFGYTGHQSPFQLAQAAAHQPIIDVFRSIDPDKERRMLQATSSFPKPLPARVFTPICLRLPCSRQLVVQYQSFCSNLPCITHILMDAVGNTALLNIILNGVNLVACGLLLLSWCIFTQWIYPTTLKQGRLELLPLLRWFACARRNGRMLCASYTMGPPRTPPDRALPRRQQRL